VVYGTQTVDRALDILDALRRSEVPLGVRELARQLGIGAASVHRTVVSLRSRGFVRQADSKAYELGWAFLEYAETVLGRTSLATIAAPYAKGLRDITGETVTVQVLSGHDHVCIVEFESLHEIRRRVGIGRRTPLHAGASGRSILAFRPEREIEDVLETLTRLTPGTITERSALRAVLDGTRRALHARSFGESVPGISAIAVPILGADGFARASLSVSGPGERWTEADMDSYLGAIVSAGSGISEALGYRRESQEALEVGIGAI
jgi:DNA-binding IclR family transcriptional regulator